MFLGPNFLSESVSTSKKSIPDCFSKYDSLPDHPDWLTQDGLFILKEGYLLEGETTKSMFKRVATASASRLEKPELTGIFFSLLWLGWLGGATPVLSNTGTDRGYPISCFSLEVDDSLTGIFNSVSELAHLSSKGGGVGIYMGNVRPRGADIKSGGKSQGVVPWCKNFDSATASVTQSSVRRGASAVYLPFSHPDAEEFLRLRKLQGDDNLKCMNLHHAFSITDKDMENILAGNKRDHDLWAEILRTRAETGEPFLFFHDNVNRHNPKGYKQHNLYVKTSNICLLEDELVLTKNGPKPIKELVGKTVTIWDGQQWVENSKFERKGDVTKLVEVTYRDGSKVKTTLNHRFPLNSGEFVEAQDLEKGMNVETHSLIYNGNTELDAAYLKGFLLAEGTCTDTKPILWIYESKYMCAERLLNCLEQVPTDANVNKQCITKPSTVAAGANRVNVQGLNARKDSLYKWCNAYKKQLPEDYLDWSFTSKVEFLAGLFDGDGTVINNKFARCYQLSSIHKEFLGQIQLLLKSIGIYSSVSSMRKAGVANFDDGYGDYKTSECYRLTVSNSSAYKMSDACKFSRLVSLQRPTKKGPYKVKPTHGEIIQVEILDVPLTHTYCTEVDSTHKFALADGRMTGNCTEVTAYTDVLHTFVCCLSSMNLYKYREWENTLAAYYALWFLEGIMQEFIEKAEGKVGFENAVRFAKKSRMLGLGVMGYHSLLQKERIPFESYQAQLLNKAIFKHISDETNRASRDMAKEYGEPEWCRGTGTRNTHTVTCAPTVSNSTICGHISPGIEPWAANCFEKRGAKGVILFYNPILKEVLAEYGQDTPEVWDTIVKHKGSIQHLSFLTEREKDVFLTAREINQMEIVHQAADRQKMMDRHNQGQSQSVNLSFFKDVDDTFFARVHYTAWKEGLKTLYYCRGESSSSAFEINTMPEKTKKKIRAIVAGEPEECLACQG